MDHTKIGGLIRRLRQERGMTQRQLAERMGISDKTVSKWERGMGCPDLSLLPDLSNIFHVGLDQLLTGENPEWLVPFLPALVSMAAETAVLILGVWLAMEGRFTTGMLLAFQGFLGAFTAPASQLIGAGQTLQEAETSGKLSGALGGTYTQLILNE